MYHPGVQHEILLTGIGGQGIQLAARTVAEAAITDGRRVQLFASYGGMMRGGNSDAAVVLADGPITAPPVLSSAAAGLVMHHEHAAPVWSALRPGGVAVVNTTVVDRSGLVPRDDLTVVDVDALAIATSLGAPVAASLVLVGAWASAVGLVGADALLATPERVLPGYRAAAAERNRSALQAGLDAVGPLVAS